MAAAATNVPWSDDTDQFIGNIDRQVSSTYGLSLRDLLLTPEKFAQTKDITKKVDGIRKAINTYFDNLREGMRAEEDAFEKALEGVDAQYTKIDGVIATKASLSRIPYVKPTYIDFNPDTREQIFVEQYNTSLDALLAKFVNTSNYIADISTTYKKYTLGSWLFSGQKGYVVTISAPNSPILMIDRLSAEITGLLDTAAERIKLSSSK